MNELKIFENQEFGKIRSVMVNDEPYFVAKDICDILEIKNTTMAINRLDEDEVTKFNLGGLSGETNIVNEYGLYNLILASRKPEAKAFKKWITHEVIPSIRKNGMYATNELLDNPDLAIKVFEQLKQEREEKKKLQLEMQQQKQLIEKQKPKVLFADSVETSKSSVLINELAKILKQNGYDIGQNRLFEKLRNDGYLIKQKGENWNLPTQKAMEKGLFEVKKTVINKPDGTLITRPTTKVTGKGQVYFVDKFLKEVS